VLPKICQENAGERFTLEKGDQFLCDLYEKTITRNSDKLRRLIRDRELDFHSLWAIKLDRTTSNTYFNEKSLAVAASLTNDRYYSNSKRLYLRRRRLSRQPHHDESQMAEQ
jgi:hypothetical protein